MLVFQFLWIGGMGSCSCPHPTTMTQVYNQFGVRRNISDLLAVGKLEKLKQKSGSNPWPVIEECIKIWTSKHPSQWNSYLYYIDDIRETRKDKKFASTKDKIHDGYLRYTIDIPQTILLMIRCLYTATELPMNREFFLAFGKRYPAFRIPEKL